MRSKRNQLFCNALIGLVLVCFLAACGSKEDLNGQEPIKENNSVEQEASSEEQAANSEEKPSDSKGQAANPEEKPSDSKEQAANSEEKPSASEEQVTNSEEKPSDSKEPAVEAKDSYKEILLGKEDFINIDIADQHRKINLENIKEVVSDDEEIKVRVTKFAMIDLDGDGEKEIVLWIQVNQSVDYGFEILYLCNNKVYGFTLAYRQFMELKTDGTFYGLGGAADTRVCRLQLSENGYVIEDVSDTGKTQEEKDNVEWHDLTEDNISRITGNKK